MVTEERVLNFFSQQLPRVTRLGIKSVTLRADDILQEYAAREVLVEAIANYAEHFKVDITAMEVDNYFPWTIRGCFRKWLRRDTPPVAKTPLTVRMFANSARAGRWLY